MRKLTHEEFENKVRNKHGNEFEFLEQYVNNRTKIKTKHKKCNYVWLADPHSLSTGHGCPKCSNNVKKTDDSFKQEVYDLVGEEYEVIGKYKTTHTPIEFKHKECGVVFKMSPRNFLLGQRCPNEKYKRSAQKNMRDIKEVNKMLEKSKKGEYTLIDDYKGISRPATIKHEKCGRLIKTKPYLIINNASGCPYCYKSKAEDIIEEYLKGHNFEFKTQFRIKECKNIRPLPFDFAIFNNGELQFLLEYDGIQHFKPKFGQANLERTQLHDKMKNKFCEKNNIDLKRIKYKRIQNQEKFAAYVISELEKILSLY